MRIPDLKPFVARYEGAGKIVEEELLRWILRVLIRAVQLSVGLVRKDTRHLARSIAMTPPTFAGGQARGAWGTALPYARANEFGRRAGAAMPPLAPIAAWLRRHGRSPALAFVVARAIGRRGIPAQSFMRAAKAKLLPEARRDFDQVAKRIIARVSGR